MLLSAWYFFSNPFCFLLSFGIGSSSGVHSTTLGRGFTPVAFSVLAPVPRSGLSFVNAINHRSSLGVSFGALTAAVSRNSAANSLTGVASDIDLLAVIPSSESSLILLNESGPIPTYLLYAAKAMCCRDGPISYRWFIRPTAVFKSKAPIDTAGSDGMYLTLGFCTIGGRGSTPGALIVITGTVSWGIAASPQCSPSSFNIALYAAVSLTVHSVGTSAAFVASTTLAAGSVFRSFVR